MTIKNQTDTTTALLGACKTERDAVAERLKTFIKEPKFAKYDLEVDVQPHYQEEDDNDASAGVNLLVYSNMGEDESILQEKLEEIADELNEQSEFEALCEYSEAYITFPFHVWTIIVGTNVLDVYH